MRILRHTIVAVLAGAVLQLPGCQGDDVPKQGAPSVSTILVSKISERAAESGGVVTSDGGSPVTARGVCWGRDENPTIANDFDDQGTGTGKFQSFMLGLTGSTTYYVRAYATNAFGTGYGGQVTFKTQPPQTLLPDATAAISDKQGNTYSTRKIGNQTWMAENLKASVFSEGSAISFVRDATWPMQKSTAYCWVENDDTRTRVYGYLYNYYVASDSRNVCPAGWHVPTVDEWKTMIMNLGGSDVAGGKLKETGTAHWTSPNAAATNASGFNALPAGSRNIDYQNFTISGYFWTSSSEDSALGILQEIRYSGGDIYTSQQPATTAASIRCVQN